MHPIQASAVLDSMSRNKAYNIIEDVDEHEVYYAYVIVRSWSEKYAVFSFGPTGMMYHGSWTRAQMIDHMVTKFQELPTQ